MATAVYKGRQRGLQLQPQYAAFCQCRINMPPSSFSNTVRLSRPALITEEMAFAIESRYQETALSTENGLLRVSVDVQAASKAANERRKRNAKAVRRCRQRRKDRWSDGHLLVIRSIRFRCLGGTGYFLLASAIQSMFKSRSWNKKARKVTHHLKVNPLPSKGLT